MRGRRGAFGAFIDVRGSLATTVDPWTPTVFDVAGVTLSAPEARFAWQAWRVRCLHRCPRNPWTPTVFYVAGVALSAPEARFAWQAWYFRYLHRCPRKLGTFGTFTDVRGSLAMKVDPWTPTVFSVAGLEHLKLDLCCVAGDVFDVEHVGLNLLL